MFKVREAIVRYRTIKRAMPMVTCPEDIAKYFQRKVKGTPRERFFGVFLSQSHKILCFEEIAIGGPTEVMMLPKEVVRTALLVGAEAIVLVHNHPSGCCKPSPKDVEITKRIKRACKMFDLHVTDHIVIGMNGKYLSMKQEGTL